jgi:uncharacterized protein (TIGR02186 family)
VIVRLIALLIVLLSGAALAKPRIVTDLSARQIDIEYSFDGADLLLFGAVDAGGTKLAKPIDVVVVVRGPEAPVTVRRKDRIAGIWMNTDAVRFQTSPSFYRLISTRPIETFASEQTLAIYELGVDQLHFTPDASGDQSGADIRAFRDGFVRARERFGLFGESGDGVTLLSDVLFRAQLRIPSRVQTGDYEAEVYLFADGAVAARTMVPLVVQKSGFERFLYTWAHTEPFGYGLVAVLIALMAGWGAAALFGRRR